MAAAKATGEDSVTPTVGAEATGTATAQEQTYEQPQQQPQQLPQQLPQQPPQQLPQADLSQSTMDFTAVCKQR